MSAVFQENYPPVKSKEDFVRRYHQGEFGNASPTYRSVDELLTVAKDYQGQPTVPGLFHLRNRVAGGETHYNLHWSACVAKWITQGDKAARSQWYASQMAPHDQNLIQGEVCQTHPGSGRCGLDLTFSRVNNLPMRDALRLSTETLSGVCAVELLRELLCPNSYEWLQILLDRYPYHVVEFSTFRVKWGTLFPKFNTVFWEVRDY